MAVVMSGLAGLSRASLSKPQKCLKDYVIRAPLRYCVHLVSRNALLSLFHGMFIEIQFANAVTVGVTKTCSHEVVGFKYSLKDRFTYCAIFLTFIFW